MDATTHTVISLGLLIAFFYWGRWLGYKTGVVKVYTRFLTALEIQDLTIDENNEIWVTDMEGNRTRLKK